MQEEEEELVIISSEEEQDAPVVKEGEDVSEKGVTIASFQESEAALEEPEKIQQGLEKGAATSEPKGAPVSVIKHQNPLKLALDALPKTKTPWLEPIPASFTPNHVLLAPQMKNENRLVAKDQQTVDIKKQSSPLGTDHEEEVIDASGADSVEGLLDLALKSEKSLLV